MNAIRQIVTPDASGNLPIRVPVELRQRPVEVIVVPLDETPESAQPLLTGPTALENAWKVIRKAHLAGAFKQSMATLREEAYRNGLTEEMLEDLLRDDT